MLHPVGAVLLVVAFEERDPLPVGTPFRLAAAAAARRRRGRLLPAHPDRDRERAAPGVLSRGPTRSPAAGLSIRSAETPRRPSDRAATPVHPSLCRGVPM